MGHRSEWQLAFLGTRKKLLKLEKFLQNALNDKKRPVAERNAVSVLLGSKTMVAENKKEHKRALAFGHSSTNCDAHWDKFIEEVMALARDRLKIKASYARLGEEMEDYEFDDEEGLRLHYTRSLTEVDL